MIQKAFNMFQPEVQDFSTIHRMFAHRGPVPARSGPSPGEALGGTFLAVSGNDDKNRKEATHKT